MACISSKQTVEKALHSIDGLTSVQVSLNLPETIIVKADEIILAQLYAAFSKADNYCIGICESYNFLIKRCNIKCYWNRYF